MVRNVETRGDRAIAEAASWLGLSAAQVRIAVQYYADYPAEIDAWLAKVDAQAVQTEASSGAGRICFAEVAHRQALPAERRCATAGTGARWLTGAWFYEQPDLCSPEPEVTPIPWWQRIPDWFPEPVPVVINPCLFMPWFYGIGSGSVDG